MEVAARDHVDLLGELGHIRSDLLLMEVQGPQTVVAGKQRRAQLPPNACGQ
nr:hypothetical protein [Lacticaseibacillus sharpeae]